MPPNIQKGPLEDKRQELAQACLRGTFGPTMLRRTGFDCSTTLWGFPPSSSRASPGRQSSQVSSTCRERWRWSCASILACLAAVLAGLQTFPNQRGQIMETLEEMIVKHPFWAREGIIAAPPPGQRRLVSRSAYHKRIVGFTWRMVRFS